MRPTSRLLDTVRITLFTRPGCGLCDAAKDVLSGLRARRPFAYREVDIAREEARGWRDLYDFDVPVVSPVPVTVVGVGGRGVLKGMCLYA